VPQPLTLILARAQMVHKKPKEKNHERKERRGKSCRGTVRGGGASENKERGGGCPPLIMFAVD